MSKIISNDDVAYITPRGVGIRVKTLRTACFSNVSQEDVDNNIDILLEAQKKASDKECEQAVEIAGQQGYEAGLEVGRKQKDEEWIEWLHAHESMALNPQKNELEPAVVVYWDEWQAKRKEIEGE